MSSTTQELVEIFCQQDHIASNLLYIAEMDIFFLYDTNKKYFKALKPLEMEKMIYSYVYKFWKKNISVSMIRDFIGQVRYKIYRQAENLSSPFVALQNNKTLNIENFEVIDSSPNNPAFYYLNVDPSVLAAESTPIPSSWQTFMDEVLVVPKTYEPDRELQYVVQEMVGYYLLNSLEAHATFFLVGSGSNGKSVFLSIIRELVGPSFCEAISIENMTTNRFSTYNLIGKKINICNEEESSYIKSDKFKALVSGDPISIERKYGDSFMWEPTVKHIFATNDMPTFSGFNFGLIRRIFIVPFHRKIEDSKKDTKLTQKLLQDISGIMAWALAGAKRLKENNYRFSPSAQMSKMSYQFQENISAAMLFFNEAFEEGLQFITDEQLYEEYKVWADYKGKKKQSFYVFTKDIDTMEHIKKDEKANDLGVMAKGRLVTRKSDRKKPMTAI